MVLLQIRNKLTGRYMAQVECRRIAEGYGVPIVRRDTELEGGNFGKALRKMKDRSTGSEGVVVKLANGQLVKIKEKWWQAAENHKYRRWWDEEQRQVERERRKRKERRCDIQEWRVIVKGLAGEISPEALLGRWQGAKRVEAFYCRNTGRRGAVVMSFESRNAKEVAMEDVESEDALSMVDAYSCRSSSNAWHRVRTWYI